MVAEKPILFQGRLVKAILKDIKTETRRVIKPQFIECNSQVPQRAEPGQLFVCPDMLPTSDARGRVIVECESRGGYHHMGTETFIEKHGRYGKVSDRLWVKETSRVVASDPMSNNVSVEYRVDNVRQWRSVPDDYLNRPSSRVDSKWRPSIHMPRWASRITLEITGLNIERLQDITDDSALAEGVSEERIAECKRWEHAGDSPRQAFSELWEVINTKPKPVTSGGSNAAWIFPDSTTWHPETEQSGSICGYVSFPWDGKPEILEHRGLPWRIIPNPWVAVIQFKRLEGA